MSGVRTSEAKLRSPATELRLAQKAYDNAHHRWHDAYQSLAYAKERLELARKALRDSK